MSRDEETNMRSRVIAPAIPERQLEAPKAVPPDAGLLAKSRRPNAISAIRMDEIAYQVPISSILTHQRVGDCDIREDGVGIDDAEAKGAVGEGFSDVTEGGFAVVLNGDLGTGTRDLQALGQRGIDVSGDACEFSPCRAVGHAEDDDLGSGDDAGEVAALGVVSDRGGAGSEQDAGVAGTLVAAEVDGNGGGKVVGNGSVEDDFFPAAVVVDRFLRSDSQMKAVFPEVDELVVAEVTPALKGVWFHL